MNDSVNSPSHYTSHPSGIECVELAEKLSFCHGNALKYAWRAGLKTYEVLDRGQIKSVVHLEKDAEYNTDVRKCLCYLRRASRREVAGPPVWSTDKSFSTLAARVLVHEKLNTPLHIVLQGLCEQHPISAVADRVENWLKNEGVQP